jgi:hypothetical protein
MNPETHLQQRIRLACSVGRSRLFRNNVGALRDATTGRLIRFGLCPGSADLIGWRRLTITPEMVGTTIAQFVSLEVKAPGRIRETRPDQLVWRDQVAAAGGLAVIADSVKSATTALTP